MECLLRNRFPLASKSWTTHLAVALLWLLAGAAPQAAAQEGFSAPDLEFFEAKIRPILVARCFECHGEEEGSGGLHLTSRAEILEGGDTGPAIDLKNIDESLLVQAIRYTGDNDMPPDSKLPAEEIELLTEWVKRGAPWPADSAGAKQKSEEAFDLAKRKAEHWCWKEISKPQPPVVRDTNWGRDPIDQFILSKVEAANLKVASDADRAVLLRRVYFDLIGLPPNPEEIKNFVEDASPEAFAKVVDRLLASPQFGERWARHWMDLTRYAETYGHEFDYPIHEAFRYRDYLIRAFNADLPYNQFIKEQMAGDLLPEPRLHPTEKYNESLIGTGFWYFGEETHSPVDVKGDEAGHIDNQIDVLTKSFLGMTVSCARCHDHKFDAISTADYYALSGFLQSSRHQKGMLDPGGKIAEKLAESRKQEALVELAFHSWKESQLRRRGFHAELWADVIAFLRESPRPPVPAEIFVQAEGMRVTPPANGEAKPQHRPRQANIVWSGDHHLLWTGGKPADTLGLKFDLPEANEYVLNPYLTQGPEFGRVELLLDDQPLGPAIDCHAEKIGRLQPLGWTVRQMAAGEHTLKIRFVEGGKSSVEQPAIGLDGLRLVRADQQTALSAWNDLLKRKLSDTQRPWEFELGLSLVDEARDWSHPAYALRRLSELRDQPLATAIQTARNELTQASAANTEHLSKSVRFSDFELGLLGWFTTGAAMEDAWQAKNHLAPNGELIPGGVVSSRRWGDGFQGALRSPTFPIEQGQVHIRYRGKGGQARVIVDGYDMDIFNGLLFEGMSIGLPEASEFSWVTIAGSLRNYLGHKAHLEIIDQGGGYFEVDEVRFSNGENAPAGVDPANLETLAGESEELSVVSAQFARHFSRQLQAETESSPKLASALLKKSKGEVELADEQGPALNTALEDWANAVREIPSPVLCLAITEGTPENEFVFIRGNHKSLGPEVPRRNLEALDFSDAEDYASVAGSGRLKLAEEIASAENPLTSRVIVNRLWHHLFGRGIVESVDNFGVLGTLPTHPELLDYLASEFTAEGWSLKRMIRRMVLSRTYQLSTTPNSLSRETDPANQLFHVHNLRRLEGESLRDAILAVSGDLDLTMYGPSVSVHLTPFMQGRGRPGHSGPLDGNRRRSVYLEVRRNFLNPMMLAFDTPAPFSAIGKRNVSNVPAQALILMNDPFVLEQAERWARRLLEVQEDAETRVNRMFVQAIGRPPTAEELQRCLRFVTQDVSVDSPPVQNELEAWRDLAHVLFNLKEFAFVY
jgi:cytochrome c553